MFATLLTGLPAPDGARDLDAQIAAVVRAQEAAGLEPITDGRLRGGAFERLVAQDIVDGWRSTAALTDRAVKQALPGPYSLALKAGADDPVRLAAALREVVEALAAAGCPLIEIKETHADRIGDDEAQRRRFREAHRRLIDGIQGTHLSLSIVGGSAAGAGIETVLDAPYASLAVDLINGPDNWNLVTRVPGERGVVAGVQGSREGLDEPKEILLWAAHYAASTGGRGINRVGLGSAGSWVNLTWAAAVRKMQLLGSTARLATLPPGGELLQSVEPQAVSARRAALGRNAPPAPRRKRPR